MASQTQTGAICFPARNPITVTIDSSWGLRPERSSPDAAVLAAAPQDRIVEPQSVDDVRSNRTTRRFHRASTRAIRSADTRQATLGSTFGTSVFGASAGAAVPVAILASTCASELGGIAAAVLIVTWVARARIHA
jgi:hypothetical protein